MSGATSPEKLKKAEKQLALQMKATAVPVMFELFSEGVIEVAMMFGQHPVVKFEELAATVDQTKLKPLSVLVGATDIDKPLVLDLADMPHLIIGGTTNSGKSIMLHSIIRSLTGGLGARKQVQLALIDPKQVEFSRYDSLDPKILGYDVATSLEQAVAIVEDLEDRMRSRMKILASVGCKNIQEYHARGSEKPMPYVVCIVDEFADLMRAKKSGFAQAVLAISAMGRAVGIHLVLGTQHPNADVLTGPIKANFSSRIALQVATGRHSMVILDRTGAENLVGKGDALLVSGTESLLHFRGAYIEHAAFAGAIPKRKPAGLLGKLLGR